MSKTHIDKLKDSTYISGVELQNEQGETVNRNVKIKEVKKENVFNQRTQEEEPVVTVHFEDCKPLILNSTNTKRLKKASGTNFIEEMVGKTITLTTEKTKAFGQIWDAVRILEQAPKVLTPEDIQAAIQKISGITDLGELQKLYNSDIKFKTNKEIVDAVRAKNKELSTPKADKK